MQDLNFSQLGYEIESCKRLLNFIIDENVHLKNRLAEVMKDHCEENMLESMENYLSKFVAQDDLTHLLKNDISKIEKRLFEKIHEEDDMVEDIYRSLCLMQSNILERIALFMKLSVDFDNFLSERLVIATQSNYSTEDDKN